MCPVIRVLSRKPCSAGLGRGIVTAHGSQESNQWEANSELPFHNSQLVFATSV
jgi:hypothetical protein